MILGAYNSVWAQHNLFQFLTVAKTNSPLLKDLANQRKLNQVDSLRIRAGLKPQLTGTATNLLAPTVKGWGYDNAVSNGGTFAELVQLNKSIVSKQNMNLQYGAIELANKSLLNNEAVSNQDLTKIISAQYITAWQDYQWVMFNRDFGILLNTELEVLKSLTEKGVYKQTDLLAFMLTLKQQKLQGEQAVMQYHSDYAQICYLSGVQDTFDSYIPEPDIKEMPVVKPTTSILLKSYEFDSLRLKNAKAQLAFNYKPKGSLYADAGYNSSSFYNDYHFFGASIGISLNVIIYDGKQRQLQNNKFSIEEDTRQNYKMFATQQFNTQVETLYRQLRDNDKMLPEIESQLKYADGLVKAYKKLMETGDVHIADYIMAINNYKTIGYMLIQNKATRYQIINQLNYLSR